MASRQSGNDWKKRLGVVYSTGDNFDYSYESSDEKETLPAGSQLLSITLDKKQRGGKQVTLITGFQGKQDDLKDLGKFLKSKCGVGGSVKDGVVIVQGNQIEKLVGILLASGYRVRNK